VGKGEPGEPALERILSIELENQPKGVLSWTWEPVLEFKILY
jgi:hypothetical protein